MQRKRGIISLLFLSLTLSSLAQQLPSLIPFKKGEKWGYADSTLQIIIPCTYQSTGLFSNGTAEVQLDNKKGLINRKNKVIVPLQIEPGKTHIFKVRDLIFILQQTPYAVQVFDTNGLQRQGISYYPLYDHFQQGLLTVKYEDGSYGFVDQKWKPALNGKHFERAEQFSEGTAAVKIDGLWGYVNLNGDLVIKPQYIKANPFYQGLALITYRKEEKFAGYEAKREEPDMPSDSVAIYLEVHSQRLINKEGQAVFTFEPTDHPARSSEEAFFRMNFLKKKKSGGLKNYPFLPYRYNEGVAVILDSTGKAGFINEKAEIIIPPAYGKVADFSEGLVTVCENSNETNIKCKVVDKKNNSLTPFSFHHISPFVKGFSVVRTKTEKGNYNDGVIDRNGKIRLDVIYENLQQTDSPGIFTIPEVNSSGKHSRIYLDIYGKRYAE